MGFRRRKRKRSDELAVQPATKRKLLPIVAAVVGVGVVAAVVFVNLPGREPDAAKGRAQPAPTSEAGSASPPNASTPDNPTAAASDAKPSFDVLKGRWLRPDGGYIVEVKSVDAGGKMDASYSNPRRINVSKAEASRDGPAIKVFIELRDANYPGSTYNLTYYPQSDQLQGVYYQAALQQQFEVFFVRMK
jgi:hypothetical protein